MEPKIITRETFDVMGVLDRVDPHTADYEAIWRDQFDPVHDRVQPYSTDEGYYGVYFATDEPGLVDMVAGMAVGDVDDVPEGLTVRTIPGGQYAVFECGMDAIGPTWGAIYSEWLPASEQYEEDGTRACFEYFPPGSETGQMLLSIFVPLRPKGSA